jgi:hypothetical protein
MFSFPVKIKLIANNDSVAALQMAILYLANRPDEGVSTRGVESMRLEGPVETKP